MKIELLHHTPLWVCDMAVSKCWGTDCKAGSDALERINRVGNKNRHGSILEHLVYSFNIEGISRAVLQELARHRHASLSVRSTRYTLKELREESPFSTFEDRSESSRVAKYLVLTDVEQVDDASVKALENLRQLVVASISNDKAKYALPEAYKTELVYTINMRSLQNLIGLRTDKSALWEFREIASAMFWALPEEHRPLAVHCVKTDN